MSLLHADVAVVGTELCGLAAAALLAHERRRVVVIDDAERIEARPLGDRLVPVSPTLWRPPTTGVAAELMEQLGLRQRARHELGEVVGLGLIDDPDLRLVLEVDPEERLQELVRAFGDEGRGPARLFESYAPDERDALLGEAALLHEEGLLARYRAKKRLDELGDSGSLEREDALARGLGERGLGAVLPHLIPYVQSLADSPEGGLAAWLATGPLAQGTLANARGGLGVRASMRGLFAEVVQGHTGDVLWGTRATTIHADGKRVMQVDTDGQNHYRVRAIVDASASRTLCARLPEGKRRDKSEALDASVPLAGDAAIVRWLLPKTVLPRGLGPRSLVLSESDTLPTAVLSLHEGLPPGPDAKKRDDSVVAVVFAARCAEGRSEAVADALEERLDDLMPYARQRREAADRIAGDAARLALPSFREAAPAHHLFGGRRPQTGFLNLFRAGRDLAPALGVDGELAAAKSVVAAVQRVLHKSARGES
jgi:hypothetical protein